MSRLKYVRHRLCNALYVYCRGRAVTNVGKTCGPTPCFVLAINTFKLNYSLFSDFQKVLNPTYCFINTAHVSTVEVSNFDRLQLPLCTGTR